MEEEEEEMGLLSDGETGKKLAPSEAGSADGG